MKQSQMLINTFPYFYPCVHASWVGKWVCFGCSHNIPSSGSHWNVGEPYRFPDMHKILLSLVVCHGGVLVKDAQLRSSVCIMASCLSWHLWINLAGRLFCRRSVPLLNSGLDAARFPERSVKPTWLDVKTIRPQDYFLVAQADAALRLLTYARVFYGL